MKTHNTSVLVVGAGPVGLILSHFLGQAKVSTLQIEAEAELSDEPRAVGLDPESLRSLQSLGLLDVLRPDILFGVTGEYLNGEGERLFALEDDQPGPLGYPGLSSFNQPALVRTLARELESQDSVSLKFEHCLLDFEQDEDGVRARVEQANGDILEVHADYLVACDGGRSVVRNQLGIKMEGESNPQPWLVIDTREQIHDGKQEFRFFCDPKRPGMFLQTPHNNRRWEWMVLPGESRESFLEDESIRALISPYVDVNTVDIYRRRVYDFHALVADSFQAGRVFLAGDAAHMTPPFAGQGLNSGIRDVVNLGWKLGATINGGAAPSLLDSYEQERRPHARELIDVAMALGQQIQPTDPELAAARDAAFAELNSQADEVMENFVESLVKAMTDRSFADGAAIDIDEDYITGRMLTQPQIVSPNGVSCLLDEKLGNGFAILGFNCDPALELDDTVLLPWRANGTTIVALDSALDSDAQGLGANSEELRALFSQSTSNMVLVRPDRFCMAAFTSANAADKLSRAATLLALSTGA